MVTANPELVNIKDSRGSTPLILATYYNYLDIAKVLLANNASIEDKDASGNTALMGVCFKGFDAIAEFLIAEGGANVNAVNLSGATALIYAATFNRQSIIKMLLSKNADKTIKDQRGNSALDHAKMQGLDDLVALLS